MQQKKYTRICIMDYKNYNLLSAIIEHINLIEKNGIEKKDIRIFEQIDDIIYILISKEHNSDGLYKELEHINYQLTEKYDKKLSERIYVDFFDNLYDSEVELKEEIDIGIVIKELNIEEIEKYYKFIKKLDAYIDTLKILYEKYNTKDSSIIFDMLNNQIEPMPSPHFNTMYIYKNITK